MGKLGRLVVLWVAVSISGVSAETHLLDQGWTPDERAAFWFRGQGSEVLPYQWLFHLKNPDGTDFLSDENVHRMGYVRSSLLPDSELNPDGLPIGFVKTVDPDDGSEWFGFNCAACHTNTITHDGKTLFVDGAPTLANIELFMEGLKQAYEATLEPAAFDQFAVGVLGADSNADKVDSLRGELTTRAADWASYMALMEHEVQYGYGRLDALGYIYNRVLAEELGVPGNKRPPEAPVSYPHLWQSAQADWIQWNGDSYNQVRFLAIMRSIVEQMGVFARLEVTADDPLYDSSMLLDQTSKFLDLIEKLEPPVWPAGLLPVPDLDRVANGRVQFQKHCASCHTLVDREHLDRPYEVTLEPTVNVGTDIETAKAAVRTVSSGPLTGQRLFPIVGPPLEPQESAFSVLIHVAMGVARENSTSVYLANMNWKNIKAFIHYVIYWGMDLVQPRYQYKAGPLNGVWATAPYLHNGSVPNLRQLLRPAAERSKTFFVGCRVFDPDNVGYAQPAPGPAPGEPPIASSTECDPAFVSEFDTALKGNTNTGHEYGVTGDNKMSPDEVEDLLEFLKVL